MSKNTGKKRNRVDPVMDLAEKNRKASITAAETERSDRTERKTQHHREQTRNYNSGDDPALRDIEADRLFKEMKRLYY
jgi:hypothetical protein